MLGFYHNSVLNFSTPYLEACERTLTHNLQRATAYVRTHGLKLRPHTKTHKNLDLARRQLTHHHAGLTVAKVGEAQVMAELGAELLLAYPLVVAEQAIRLAHVARDVPVIAAIDSPLAAQVLSKAGAETGVELGVLVDLDVGMHRTGVQGIQPATELARLVDRLPALTLRGIFCYPGHVIEPADQQATRLNAIAALLDETLDAWSKAGLNASIVSGGSTPTLHQSHLIRHLTEVRPGTYLFNDMNTVAGGFCGIEDCALHAVCTVVSTAVPGQVVIDAGSKVLTSDTLVGHPGGGFGRVVDYPDARVRELNEEHGMIDVTRCPRPPELGEQLRVIPNHVCPCVNLQDAIALRGEDGSLRPLTVHARGKSS